MHISHAEDEMIIKFFPLFQVFKVYIRISPQSPWKMHGTVRGVMKKSYTGVGINKPVWAGKPEVPWVWPTPP